MCNGAYWRDQIEGHLESTVLEINLPYPRWRSGKVREVFDLGETLLIVASDRISAFDVIMGQGIPGKGVILTQLSRFWFWMAGSWGLVPDHLVPNQDEALAEVLQGREEYWWRSMLVRKLEPIPMEAVVRGYLAGSGWKAYRKTGRLFDREVPAGLSEADALPEALFTPSSKAESGHDEALSHREAEVLVGSDTFHFLKETSLKLYAEAQKVARKAGILLADTKFEFGKTPDGAIFLMDEIFTPDSSRYWPVDRYRPGRSQPSFDKQYVRDFLEGCVWDKQPPPPPLTAEIIEGTRERYRTAYERLTATADPTGLS